MNEPESNHEDDLALLLQRLCELKDDADVGRTDLERQLDHLSEEELGDLIGAGQCLNLLHRLQDSTDPGDHDLADTAKQRVTRIEDGARPNRDLIPEQIGNYEIIRLAARGGFANIYLARDTDLGRDIALKVPHSDCLNRPEAIERFQREARAVATLTHPAIVPVFDSGKTDLHLFIALQWVPGRNLDAFLKDSTQPIPVREAAGAIERIAGAVAHAHSKGILHRDIKPANLLLAEDELDEKPWFDCLRITDFGLAKHFSDSNSLKTITVDGSILGTPAYMSPEQVRAESDIGPAADIYSLGTVLYELLTGETPHRKSTYVATIRAIENETPVPISKIRRGVPADLIAICQKCLAKDPKNRYSSAYELTSDLERFRTGYPVKAKRPNLLNQFSQWVKRNPLVAVCLAIALISLSVGVVASTVSKNQATASRDEMQQQVKILKSIFEDLNHDRDGAALDEEGLRDRLARRMIRSASLIADSKDAQSRGELLTTLASTLVALGYPKDAHRIVSNAIELSDDSIGLELQQQMQVELGKALSYQGKSEEGAEVLAATIDAMLANERQSNRAKVDALFNLAETRFQAAKFRMESYPQVKI